MKTLYSFAMVMIALSMGVSLAEGTAAGTKIDNTASASFTDPDGGDQTVASNTVTTVTAPRAGVSVSGGSNDPLAVAPAYTYSRTPGAEVAVIYTLTNTGNFTNSYALTPSSVMIDGTPVTVEFYVRNGDGSRGALIAAPVSLAADASQSFFMVYTVPAATTLGTTVVTEPVATAQATSYTIDAVAYPVEQVTDGLAPDVKEVGAAENDDNYHKVTVVAGAAITATKTVVGVFTDAAATSVRVGRAQVGDYIKYAISASNTSAINDAINVAISDALPAGTQYVSASFSTGTGAITSATTSFTATPTAGTIAASTSVTVEVVSQIISLSDALADGANDAIVNSATVAYDDPLGAPSPDPTPTSPAIDVAAVGLGPKDYPAGNAPVGAGADFTLKQPTGETVSLRADADELIIDTMRLNAAGDTQIVFPNTVKNTGTATDKFSLQALGLPAGVSVKFYSSYNPVTGALSSEITTFTPDLVAGDSYTFYTAVTLDATYTSTSTGVAVTVDALSNASSGVVDSTTDRLGATPTSTPFVKGVLGGHDDGANANDSDEQPDNVAALVQSGVPGAQLVYPIDLVNTSANGVTLNPSGSLSVLGTTITYYFDTNNNGTFDGADLPVTAGVPLASGEEVRIFGVFTLPAGAAIGSYNLIQSFDDPSTPGTDLSSAAGTFPQDQVVVGDFSFTQNESGVVTKPGSIVYTHVLTNSAPLGSGLNIKSFVLNDDEATDVGVALNFAVTYFLDSNNSGTLDAGDAAISKGGTVSVNIDPGATTKVFAKVVHNGQGTIPQSDATVISLQPTFYSGATPLPALPAISVTDTTSLRNTTGTPSDSNFGGPYSDPNDNPENYAFRPFKTVSKAAAQPGESLQYTVYAKNTRLETASLKGVIVSDDLSGTNVGGQATLTAITFEIETDQAGTVVYRINGGSWTTYTSGASISAPEQAKIEVGVDTNASSSVDAGDVLASAKYIRLIIDATVK